MHGPKNMTSNQPLPIVAQSLGKCQEWLFCRPDKEWGLTTLGGDSLFPPCVMGHFGQEQNCPPLCIHPIPLYSFFFGGEQRACMHLCAVNVSSGHCLADITSILDICSETFQVVWTASDFCPQVHFQD